MIFFFLNLAMKSVCANDAEHDAVLAALFIHMQAIHQMFISHGHDHQIHCQDRQQSPNIPTTLDELKKRGP